jgi:hypothetical protein
MENSLLHDISEAELIFRLRKWIDLCREKKAETEIENFPELKKEASEKDDSLISKGLEVAKKGAELAEKLAASGAVKSIGRFVPGGGLAMNVLQWATGTGPQKINHQQIKEIALRYLAILDFEAEKQPQLREKYTELLAKFEENCREADKKKSWF